MLFRCYRLKTSSHFTKTQMQKALNNAHKINLPTNKPNTPILIKILLLLYT